MPFFADYADLGGLEERVKSPFFMYLILLGYILGDLVNLRLQFDGVAARSCGGGYVSFALPPRLFRDAIVSGHGRRAVAGVRITVLI